MPNRPRDRRAADERDELATRGHSITSSASASRFDGTSDRVPWRTLALLRSGLRDLLANDYAATYPDASFVATIFARR